MSVLTKNLEEIRKLSDELLSDENRFDVGKMKSIVKISQEIGNDLIKSYVERIVKIKTDIFHAEIFNAIEETGTYSNKKEQELLEHELNILKGKRGEPYPNFLIEDEMECFSHLDNKQQETRVKFFEEKAGYGHKKVEDLYRKI